MAVIEYKIEITSGGTAIVTQDVLLLEVGDRVRFNDVFANGAIAIRFPTATPFGDPRLGVDVPFQLQPIAADVDPNQMVFQVAVSNAQAAYRTVPKYFHFDHPGPPPPAKFSRRRTFHFDCGQLVNGVFQPWGGGGGDTPDGGKGN
jgi:hypothetical protein